MRCEQFVFTYICFSWSVVSTCFTLMPETSIPLNDEIFSRNIEVNNVLRRVLRHRNLFEVTPIENKTTLNERFFNITFYVCIFLVFIYTFVQCFKMRYSSPFIILRTEASRLHIRPRSPRSLYASTST